MTRLLKRVPPPSPTSFTLLYDCALSSFATPYVLGHWPTKRAMHGMQARRLT